MATLHSYTLDYAPLLLTSRMQLLTLTLTLTSRMQLLTLTLTLTPTSRMQLLTISGNSLEHTRKVIAA